MRHVLGIDVSTTATKACSSTRPGRSPASAWPNTGTTIPAPLWSEQDPELWWEARRRDPRVLATAGTPGEEVAAVGLTGQMHGLVLLDEADTVLRPAILWNDQRTAAECDLIRALVGPERLIEVTGNDALPGFTAPKLVWVRDHEPAIWSRIAHVLLPKDYVRLRLTGAHALDKADGAGTLLFDLAARDWSPEVLGALGIEPAWMPRTFEGPEVTGVVTRGRRRTGLRGGTPVVAGGGDQAANAVGVGAVTVGTVALSLGTRGSSSRRRIDRSRRDGRVHAFCHAVPGRWHLMSVMLSAAGSLRWYRDAIAPGTPFGDLVAEAGRRRRRGARGCVFLPYLTGERSPHVDPLARGAFIGLTATHERRHLTRAVLEGVAFGLRDGLDDGRRRHAPARAGPRLGRRHGQPAYGARSWPTCWVPRSRPSARPRAPRSGPPCWPRSAPAGSPPSTRRSPGRPSTAGGRAGTYAPAYAGRLRATARSIPPWRRSSTLESDRRCGSDRGAPRAPLASPRPASCPG